MEYERNTIIMAFIYDLLFPRRGQCIVHTYLFQKRELYFTVNKIQLVNYWRNVEFSVLPLYGN